MMDFRTEHPFCVLSHNSLYSCMTPGNRVIEAMYVGELEGNFLLLYIFQFCFLFNIRYEGSPRISVTCHRRKLISSSD